VGQVLDVPVHLDLVEGHAFAFDVGDEGCALLPFSRLKSGDFRYEVARIEM